MNKMIVKTCKGKRSYLTQPQYRE